MQQQATRTIYTLKQESADREDWVPLGKNRPNSLGGIRRYRYYPKIQEGYSKKAKEDPAFIVIVGDTQNQQWIKLIETRAQMIEELEALNKTLVNVRRAYQSRQSVPENKTPSQRNIGIMATVLSLVNILLEAEYLEDLIDTLTSIQGQLPHDT